MLIATFGPSTGWAGKTIAYENDVFVLEDHGPVSPGDIMQYDQQGHLSWASDGTRAWVGARAQSSRSASLHATPHDDATEAPLLESEEDGRTDGQKAASMIGLALVILGLACAFYFFASFDTSVEVPVTDLGNGVTVGGGRVNNFGLMDQRRNGILFGFGAAAVGGVLMVVGRKRSAALPQYTVQVEGRAEAACHACGGLVEVGVAFCPRCGKPLSWASVDAHDPT